MSVFAEIDANMGVESEKNKIKTMAQLSIV